MGIGVSDWRLARAVACCGQLGVVSGTGVDVAIPRRLQLGDIGGHVQRALEHFPIPEIAKKLFARFYAEPKQGEPVTFKQVPAFTLNSPLDLLEIAVCSNFVEVWLAKEGHNGLVGVNFLEKIQLVHLPALYGAMLAGVDFVLMGAGIPLQIPEVLDKLATHQPASYRINVDGAPSGQEYHMHFNPADIIPNPTGNLKRPNFLPIISSVTLAELMVTKSGGAVNGFVIEGSIAGGHNAPPRGRLKLDGRSSPIYGDRDVVDLSKIHDIGLPFWLAGGYASPEKLQAALEAGATGVQVGSIFALCEESAMMAKYKQDIIESVRLGTFDVHTDPYASPSGFPFKVVSIPSTLADAEVYAERPRICDITRMRRPYYKPNGEVGYRCAAEPIDQYLDKGGNVEDTQGKKCLCNALFADVGLAQTWKSGYQEKALVTLGTDVSFLPRVMAGGRKSYNASDVIDYMLGTSASSEEPSKDMSEQ